MSKPRFDGETRVQQYLSGLGLQPERFSKAEMKQGRRTPDFRIFANDVLAFYCEVKTAQEDEWLPAMLAAAPVGTLGGGCRHDSTYNRISSQIHEAVRQFDSVNPALEHPNVLAIVNCDEDAGMTDLIQVVTGKAYTDTGHVIPIFRAYSEGRIREEKFRVHLYLWFNDWAPKPLMILFDGPHRAALCRYLRLAPAAFKRLPI